MLRKCIFPRKMLKAVYPSFSLSDKLSNFCIPLKNTPYFVKCMTPVTNNVPNTFLKCGFTNGIAMYSCWKCGLKLKMEQLTCNRCAVIQKPKENQTFFSLFNLSEDFEINVNNLTRRFREMQKVLHPDNFSNKSREELLISEEYSSLVNKAYSTLQNPLQRGLYILELQGITIDESTSQSDLQFLSEVMEKNEELEEISNLQELTQFQDTNKSMLKELTRQLSVNFSNSDFNTAKDVIMRLKYYNTLEEKVKEKRTQFL